MAALETEPRSELMTINTPVMVPISHEVTVTTHTQRKYGQLICWSSTVHSQGLAPSEYLSGPCEGGKLVS
jgi:hypothetical protein